MPPRMLHRFVLEDRRYVVDPESCFCFECDEITWDVLEHYPEAPLNRVFHLLEDKHSRKELEEVIGELEWLRASKSILTPPKLEQQQKSFELDRSLRRLEVHLDTRFDAAPATPVAPQAPAPQRGKLLSFPRFVKASGRAAEAHDVAPTGLGELVRRAGVLLLTRGAADEPLRLTLRWNREIEDVDPVLQAAREVFGHAAVAGKALTVALAVRADGAGAQTGDDVVYAILCTRAEVLPEAAKALEIAAGGPRVAGKAFRNLPEGAMGQVTLESRDTTCADAVEALHDAGLSVIEINLETPFAVEIPPAAEALPSELKRAARSYVEALRKGDHYRLEPVAELFHRVYLGQAAPRTDPAGLWSLAVAPDGTLYPSSAYFGNAAHALGNVLQGRLDADVLRRYEDVGAKTTAECLTCWARNLCGGGNAFTHAALSGNFRRPDPVWCDAQRAYIESAIAAFNALSGEGVNFARLYGQLGRAQKPSLFSMVRAAFQMNLGLRPIGEPDAELLTKWENFNDAAYFTFTETGLLMATRYDREMDALHPKGHEFEFMILRKNGTPIGLFRVRPLPLPGTAMFWVYLRNAADYADEGVRKSFRFLLGEAGKQQGFARLVAPCGPFDAGLDAFLRATGFEHTGNQREALYLRGAYHDVAWYAVGISS